MQIYENKNILIDLNVYAQKFKELLEKISNRFNNLFREKTEEKHVKNHKILIKEILTITEEIAQLIKKEYFIKDEYYDFRDIQFLIEDILTNESKYTQKNFNMILDLLNKLNDITEYKIELYKKFNNRNGFNYNNLSKDVKKQYLTKYKEFGCCISNYEAEYYCEGPYDNSYTPLFKAFKDEIGSD